MWWNDDWQLGPLAIMLVFAAFCIGIMLLIRNNGLIRCCGFRRGASDRRSAQESTDRPPSVTPAAFNDYRAETLERLEREQANLHDFLGRLRNAKDKAEFEAFMAGRREQSTSSNAPSQA